MDAEVVAGDAAVKPTAHPPVAELRAAVGVGGDKLR
jgi:hypothetical protein